MRQGTKHEQGAALVTVLLFMVLTFILITTMLTVTGNEVFISGLQRDGVRAMDVAQAGLQDAVLRLQEGRPYYPSFSNSLDTAQTVTVTRRYVGTNSAYQEIQSTATVGRSTRRLSLLVLQKMITFPPNITFAASVIEQGSADIVCGDAYSRTFIQYKNDPSNTCPNEPGTPNTLTYAGWRVSKVVPGAVAPCYTNAQCAAAGRPLWYPAQRVTENETSTIGADIKDQTKKCPAGGGGILPTELITGVLASDRCSPACVNWTGPRYGFDTDDPDGVGPLPPQTVTSKLPCGLPYRLDHVTFPDENGSNVTRLIKSIVFEQWFDNDFRFDESKMTFVKRNGSACVYGTDPVCLPNNKEPNLLSYAQYGAIPPFPDVSTVNDNYDRRVSGGGTINSGDFGCAWPQMTGDPNCSIAPANTDRPITVLLDTGDYTINGNLKGHGTMVVNGDLTVNGNFEYWGTVIVNGTLTLGAGSAVVHGGLVADSTLRISGNIQVEGGGNVSNVPVGRSVIIGKAWWER